MNNQRRTADTAHGSPNFHQPVVNIPSPDGKGTTLARMIFRERPVIDEMLQKVHPSKVYFDAFYIVETLRGPAAMLISSTIVDTAVRH